MSLLPPFPSSICHEVMEPDATILVVFFLNILSFKLFFFFFYYRKGEKILRELTRRTLII